MTAPGQRRELLTFQHKAADENGDLVGPWVAGCVRWGRALARTHGEVVTGQRVQGLQPLEVAIPRDPDTMPITTAWRLLWNGAVYDIKAVAPTEDRSELAILAEANQTNG
jgi:hypothetical protein